MRFIDSLKALLDRVPLYPFLFLFPMLLFAHNSHAFLHAEFWGEDGPVWYAEARDLGVASLLHADGGYLNSVQRLAAIAAQPFPLAWGPTLFVLFALCMQSAPAIFLLSQRMANAWPDKLSRSMFALLFVLMPNAPETALNVTDSQWYLAILAFLVLVSDAPKSKIAHLFDSAVLFISGLSGPFCVLFFPIGFLRVFRGDAVNRQARIWRVIILGITSCVQILLILGLSHAERETGPLGASAELLVKILAMVPLGATVGYTGIVALLQQSIFVGNSIPFLIAITGFLIFAISFLRGPTILREFIFFAAAMFALALFKPLISMSMPQWPMILTPPAGNRYFLYPMLAWWGALFVIASLKNLFVRGMALTLLATTVIFAIPSDWGDLFKLPETDFVARAHQLDASQRGTIVELPVHPPSVKMRLAQNRDPLASAEIAIDEHELDLARSTKGLCSLDIVNGKVVSNKYLSANPLDVLSFTGWGVPGKKTKTTRALLVLIGQSSHYAFSTSLGIFRPDVVANLNAPKALKSGYSSAISFDNIPMGNYSLNVLIASQSTEELCDTGFRINVEPK
ncbi:hypothetical protein [Rhodanobacter sp. MP1X3]|uniref:hypothetical protein n=1 Tax=Rhodanobacter sp. MP1X3 TaxID=2723086 RepID=UPI00160E76BA|nr:hypothetical protein [Rhodanobacter sp. MP1X3]MBB6241955.1 hypothetical protein [Rhodanobacter sp. MP1X3]